MNTTRKSARAPLKTLPGSLISRRLDGLTWMTPVSLAGKLLFMFACMLTAATKVAPF